MTDDQELSVVLHEWLIEGPREMPDRVIDVVAGRIRRQPQRPAWRLDRRPFPMNVYAKIAVAAAAVLIVALVGYNLLPGSSTGVGGPAPTASPTATPSIRPSPSASFPAWFTPESGSGGAGILSSGRQTTRSFRPAFTYSVPEGWVNSGDEANFYGLFPDTPANAAEHAASGVFAQEIFLGPLTSPYFVCEAWEDNRGATAAEMVAAMVANEALATSEPIDVTIGGLTGKQIDVGLDPGKTDSCPGDPPTFDLGDMRTRGILLDSADRGVIVIVVSSRHSAGHEAFLAQAMPIVESFQFDVGPEASPS